MSIRVVCPQGHELHVGSSWQGRSGSCPVCRSAVDVPFLPEGRGAMPVVPSAAPVAAAKVPTVVPTFPPNPPPHSESPAPASALQPELRRAAAPVIHSGGMFVSNKQERLVMALVAGMGFLGVLALLPALITARDGFAPFYSRVVLLCGLWQLALAIWVLTIPDWSALRIAMICHALLAALYAALLAATLATPPAQQIIWDLSDVRTQAVPWCGGMLTLTLLMAYASGAAAAGWKWQLRKAVGAAFRAAA